MRAPTTAATASSATEPETPSRRPDLIVSTSDAKYVRVQGRDVFIDVPSPDKLDLIDATGFPPRIVASIDVSAAVQGPPQAVAITPDARLAFVGAPSHYDAERKSLALQNFLQVVDLEARPARVVARIELAGSPQGLAVNRAGTLLLAATTAGTVAVFAIHERSVTLQTELKVSQGRLAGIAITPDSRSALVARRDEQGIAVLHIDGDRVTVARERISAGVAPYAIDICADGRYAIVGNVGLAGLPGENGLPAGDADSVTLIDTSRWPFRAVDHATVPSLPEGVAISPDGRFVAVHAMDGSNLTPDNPGRRACGQLVLFAIDEGRLIRRASLPAGVAGQGVVFTADGRYVLAQFNVERVIAVYAVNDGALADTGVRLPSAGGPSSIRSLPR